MTTIFVAKLDFGVTEDELLSVFKRFGAVSKVNIAKDKETGKPRGFAFVEMPNQEEAQQAIRGVDGYAFNGRNCVVKEAEDRGGGAPKRDSNSGGGFKPRGDFQRNDSKPYSKPEHSGSRPDFKERPKFDNELPPVRPDDDDDTSFSPLIPGKPAPKKKKVPGKSSDVDPTNNGKNKKPKINAYTKSGKDNLYFDEDEELDEDFDLFGRDEDEDEELDDVYSKYVVNSSEDEDDEEWDDEDEWEDDDEWEEDNG